MFDSRFVFLEEKLVKIITPKMCGKIRIIKYVSDIEILKRAKEVIGNC